MIHLWLDTMTTVARFRALHLDPNAWIRTEAPGAGNKDRAPLHLALGLKKFAII